MPSHPSDWELGEAVLNSVKNGSYPESEEIISAELLPSAFPIALELLEKARHNLKVHIHNDIRGISPEVDEWVAKAKQLHADLKDSEAEAQEISREARERQRHQEEVEDAASKRRLLLKELDYNGALIGILESINGIQYTLNLAEEKGRAKYFTAAIDLIADSEARLAYHFESQASASVDLIRRRIIDLRSAILEYVDQCWAAWIIFKPEERSLEIKTSSRDESFADIPATISALEKLNALNDKLHNFLRDFERIILFPVLEPPPGMEDVTVSVHGDSIKICGRQERRPVGSLLEDLTVVLRYLSTRLPPSMAIPLSQMLVPSIASRLISSWLSREVPSSLDGISTFHELVAQVISFRATIQSFGWKGDGDLTEWIENIPQVWLSKRREASLTTVRRILARGFGEFRTVERVDTRKAIVPEGILGTNGKEDWDAAWEDDENRKPAGQWHTASESIDEEDISAWDLDKDITTKDQKAVHNSGPDVEDAWGWAEEANNLTSDPESQSHTVDPDHQANKNLSQKVLQERELLLRENYTVTEVTGSISNLVSQALKDAQTLEASGSDPIYSSVAPAATGLYSLPTLILAMYRAASWYCYTKHVSGNMFLYNDSLWLAEQLLEIDQHLPEHSKSHNRRSSGRSKLAADVRILESFGKAAYGKEMEIQRNSLRDILAHAQGFTDCTIEPFSIECENVVNTIVDRIRGLKDRWKSVLSPSAVLQSLGSLLSTVTNAIIIDIEDMSDISEVESQQLARLCNRISNLEDLFLPARVSGPSDQAPQSDIPFTAVYAPNWLRFQFLVNILESSLADIKYLWTEGELSLEFSAEEIVDLIEALFADSDYRRRTIGAIRRSSVASS